MTGFLTCQATKPSIIGRTGWEVTFNYLLMGLLSEQLRPADGLEGRGLLLDSVPIMLSKGKRQVKVAPEKAADPYSSSKGMYYYRLKLHWMGLIQAGTLPLPIWSNVTSAEEHDLPSAFLMQERKLAGDEVFQDSAAYIQGWLRALKNDKRLVVEASSLAQKAADYITRGR